MRTGLQASLIKARRGPYYHRHCVLEGPCTTLESTAFGLHLFGPPQLSRPRFPSSSGPFRSPVLHTSGPAPETSRRSGSRVRSRDGERRRLRVGPRGGLQRRARRHLRQVLRHSGTVPLAYPFLRLYRSPSLYDPRFPFGSGSASELQASK